MEKITMRVEYADSNPNMTGGEAMNHFRVTLRRAGKRMTLLFSQGLGIQREPTVKDVIDCLAMDSSGYFNARGFDDWASEFGYDEDSRSAEKTYKAVERQAMRFAKFMGSDLDEALNSPSED